MNAYSDNGYSAQGPQGTQAPPTPRIIETASATTSPDNANSGNIAFIWAALGFIVICLISMSIGGCTSLIAGIFAEEGSYSSTYGDSYGQDMGNPFSDEDPYGLDGTETVGEPDGSGPNGERTLEDYRDLGLNAETFPEDILSNLPNMHISSSSINKELPAFAYANAKTEVSDFARSLATADEDANESLLDALGRAARNESERADALAEAATICENTLKDLDKLKLPTLEGEGADDVSAQLKDAQTAAIARWRAIESEVKLMRSENSVSLDDYYTYEDEVASQTTKAAEALSAALKASCKL